MTSARGLSGVSTETKLRIVRKNKGLTIAARDLQVEDFVWPGHGRWHWQVDAVERVSNAVPGWRIQLADGKALECPNGTVLAGIAGSCLPSDVHAKPSIVLIRHQVDTEDARRRFRVRLLNSTESVRPSLRRLFGSRRAYGQRANKTEKLFYYYEQACAFLAACRREDSEMDIFSAVEIDTCFSGRLLPWRDVCLAGDRPDQGPVVRVVFPLFRLDEEAPRPIALAIRDSKTARNIWVPVEKCDRLPADPNRQWVVPVFGGQSWADGEHDEERSYNPLTICASGGISVYLPDLYVSQDAYMDTRRGSERPAIIPVPKSVPTFHSLDRIGECVPAAVDGNIDESNAVDAMWKLFGAMRRAGITPEQILDRLTRRYLDEVYVGAAREQTPRTMKCP